jgi:hypothetical protein
MGNNFLISIQKIYDRIDFLPLNDLSLLFYEISLDYKDCGGSFCVIMSIFLFGLSKVFNLENQFDLKTWIDALQSGINHVVEIVNTQKNDRTFLDLIFNLIDDLNLFIENNDLKNFNFFIENDEFKNSILFDFIKKSSEKSIEKTKLMIGKIGRSSYLGDKVIGFADPGAMALYFVIISIF